MASWVAYIKFNNMEYTGLMPTHDGAAARVAKVINMMSKTKTAKPVSDDFGVITINGVDYKYAVAELGGGR